MKKTLTVLFSISVFALVGFTLYGNKQDMKEEAKLAEVKSDAIPVEITSLERKNINTAFNADGILNAKTDLAILSETTGTVVKMYKEKGTMVSKGELLAQIENNTIQAEVSAAKVNLEKVQTDMDRFTKLYKENAVTKRQLEDVKIDLKEAESRYSSAQNQLENSYIRATASGKINNDFLQVGELISLGQKLYEIIDPSILKLSVKLTASDVLSLKEGNLVKVSAQVFPQMKLDGRIISIASKADDALKYEVEIEVINKGDVELKAGMYATAHFNSKGNQEKNYLDRNALIGSIQNPEVYVVEEGKSHLKQLTLGEIRGELVEVLSGIQLDDQVVLNGQINLSEGTKVNILEK
ncbi:MAG: efflux transporter periplasmic adaptor subunit [Flavobacteriales bacterium]|nr:efflux transporter periplasmic adaptor subunit [Flavobacteriales bacterium]